MEWLYVNYHESKELKEDYNISFYMGYYKDYKISIFCMITEDNPHINIYYGEGGMWKASKVARISLLEPRYLMPPDCDINLWVFNTEEKMLLLSILKSESISYSGSGYTTWDDIIRKFNFEAKCNNYKRRLPENLPIPDYMKL